jgi:starvation-inducible DNA-binding protein
MNSFSVLINSKNQLRRLIDPIGHYDLDGAWPKEDQENKLSATLDIGISEEDRNLIYKELSILLSDTFSLYLKTLNYHWNVKGPMFYALHKLFEEQYKHLAEASDAIAERIRALGYLAPASFAEFTKLSKPQELETHNQNAENMLKQLCFEHEKIVKNLRTLSKHCDDCCDVSTNDLISHRIQWHEKMVWMIRSLIS